MTDCIFCNIAKGEVPASVIYEDDRAIAFLDINPVSEGHTLVAPKQHCADIHEITDDEIAYLYKVVKKISGAVKQAMGAAGIKVEQNNGRSSGQIIFHFHIHIIPTPQKLSETTKDRFDETAEKIRKLL